MSDVIAAGLIGAGAALLGSAVSQIGAWWLDSRRRLHDERRHWQGERFRLYAEVLREFENWFQGMNSWVGNPARDSRPPDSTALDAACFQAELVASWNGGMRDHLVALWRRSALIEDAEVVRRQWSSISEALLADREDFVLAARLELGIDPAIPRRRMRGL